MMNEENLIYLKEQIMLSMILQRSLFVDDFSSSLNNMDNIAKKMFFEGFTANIKADIYFTKLDENVNNRLYNILGYYRDLYDDEYSLTKINDSIAVLNRREFLPSAYNLQFQLRYDTIYNKRIRNKFLKYSFDDVKELVSHSVINDLQIFYDIDKLKGKEFNETYGNNLISISNVEYLLNVFPNIFYDSMVLIKLYNLLMYNIDSNQDDISNNLQLYSGSVKTLKKLDKMIKKNK